MKNQEVNRVEETMEDSFDSVQNVLLDLAPYISSMPKDYTTGLYSPKGAGIEDDEHLHFPSPEFFDLLIWNVVIAFWVNILASHIYKKLFTNDNRLKSEEEITKIRVEVLDQVKTKGFKLRLGNILETNISQTTKSRSIELLTTHGVPKDEATLKTEEVYTKLIEAVQKLDYQKPDQSS